MKNRYIIIWVFFGALIGYAIWNLKSSGYFVQWMLIDNPPEKPAKLVASREFDLYLESDEGNTWHWNHRVWSQDPVPADLSDNWLVLQPCSFSVPEFSPISSPPPGISECIRDEGIYAEFSNKHLYVLDNQGQLWEWELLNHGLALFIHLFLFVLVGAFIGLIMFLIYRWIHKSRAIDAD
jgi:hypothetical protein